MAGFEHLGFHFSDESQIRRRRTRSAPVAPPAEVSFNSNEAAARYYLHQLIKGDQRPAMRGVFAPTSPQLVPNLQMERSQDIRWPKELFGAARSLGKATGRTTVVIRFRQLSRDRPVFGSCAVVELDGSSKRGLVSADVRVGDPSTVPAAAAWSEAQAHAALADFTKASSEQLEHLNGTLTYYHDASNESWHLAWYFQKVPMRPPALNEVKVTTCGLPGESPRQVKARFDYLIDSHNGKVLRYFSSAPGLKPMQLAGCEGLDEDGLPQKFFGRRVAEPKCVEMHDEQNDVVTFDNEMKAYDLNPGPAYPVRSVTGDFGNENTAAVSAHINGVRVMRFFGGYFRRNGVDEKFMTLVSRVKCAATGGSKEWKQASWFDGKMWYGQWIDPQGNLHSCAKYLDVIAHEIMHGITEYSAGLKYIDQSGALDESLADIFAVVVSSVSTMGETSTADQWAWRIGSGLGVSGGPLRDLSKPALPHLAKFIPTFEDNGGVHALSEIHSKAAYDIFNARNKDGSLLFGWLEIIFLYYLCLCRLPPLADFSTARSILIDEAQTLFAARTEEDRKCRISAITAAYEEVGIA